MDREHLVDEIKSEAESQVRDEIKQKALATLQSSVEAKTPPALTTPESFKATPKVEKILSLFEQHFNAEDCKHLGLQKITRQSGRWFLPWDSGSFDVDLSPDEELGDAKITRPSYTDAAQQSWRAFQTYLKNKLARRKDDSLLAARYKTLLAKLCHKCVERIESLKDPVQRQKYYMKFRNFLELIWNEPTLIDPSRRHDTGEAHRIEHFVYHQRKLCEQQLCLLSSQQPITSLTDLLQHWESELTAVHICGARASHFLFQDVAIPDNLEEQLKQVGNTYHRLMLEEKSSLTALRFKVKDSAHWKKISSQAQSKLQRAGITLNEPITINTLLPYVNEGMLTLGEAVFFQVSESYTADQCLYLALYGSHESFSGLSPGQFQEYFGQPAFLKLYRTIPPQSGFQWLHWHIQQASDRLLPDLHALQEIEDEKGAAFQKHLKRLLKQLQELSNTQVICPPTSMGIIPKLQKLEGCSPELIASFQQHLAKIQQHLHCLILARALLAQYRSFLPQVGEVVGALVLRQDLLLLAGIVQSSLNETQNQLALLSSLFGMGFQAQLDAHQQPRVVQQAGLLSLIDEQKKPESALVVWRKQHAARVTHVEAFSQRVVLAEELTQQVHKHTAISKVIPLAKKAERQFRVARVMLLTAFSQHITPQHAQGLQAGDKMMSAWLTAVETGVSEHKKVEAKRIDSSSPPVALIPTRDEGRVLASPPASSPAALHPPVQSAPRRPSITAMPQSVLASPSSSGMSPIEIKMQPLQSIATDVALQGIACLQRQTSIEGIKKEWQEILNRQRENFYQLFASCREAKNDTELALFFQRKIGILFLPLPPATKPWPAWWYQQSIQNREFLFNSWCLACLVEQVRNFPAHLTPAQKELFKGWLQQEQQESKTEHQGRWRWFDGLNYNLKHKHETWEQQLINYQLTIQRQLDEKEIPLTPQPVALPITPELPREALTVSDQPQSQSRPTEIIQTPSSSSIETPLDLKIDSTEWKKYWQSVGQAEVPQKVMFCLAFLKLGRDRLQKAESSFQNPEQEKQFYAVIQLFWEHFKLLSSHWLITPLNALHQTLDAKNQKSAEIKQKFFVLQANRAIQHAEQKTSDSSPVFSV